jgi:hypothetical protein
METTLAAPLDGEARPFSWRRVLIAGTRAFGINLLLVSGLHAIPPVAFFLPVGTGFAAGWREMATWVEAVLIGLVMGLWASLLCGIVLLGVVLLSGIMPWGLESPAAMLWPILICGLIVAHLSIFAGTGAALGGHFARKELARA